MQKKMFKVITAIEKRNGEKFWTRCGTGFTNKDDSINLYLDVIPAGQKEFVLQVRELTDEDLTPRSARVQRATNPNSPPF
jgi:hypothetical protein